MYHIRIVRASQIYIDDFDMDNDNIYNVSTENSFDALGELIDTELFHESEFAYDSDYEPEPEYDSEPDYFEHVEGDHWNAFREHIQAEREHDSRKSSMVMIDKHIEDQREHIEDQRDIMFNQMSEQNRMYYGDFNDEAQYRRSRMEELKKLIDSIVEHRATLDQESTNVVDIMHLVKPWQRGKFMEEHLRDSLADYHYADLKIPCDICDDFTCDYCNDNCIQYHEDDLTFDNWNTECSCTFEHQCAFCTSVFNQYKRYEIEEEFYMHHGY